MNARPILAVICLSTLQLPLADATEEAAQRKQEITRVGTQPSMVGSRQFFTGAVRIDPIWPADSGINASGSLVTFEPGARSAWHTHPTGQRLVVTAGVGLTQQWGGAIKEIRPGDVVSCPPGIKHWHGASATTSMTHLAVTGMAEGENVHWMEKVTDEQYSGPRAQ
ncbi:cupin domain-containing protein [Pseudomonas sp. LFS044]|jgi:quercetin dioxygenase-like cupin family protein|uniref:(R)-mandelonitrile lyase n=1 Tax=Pseudomonas sp. LFS044 TaxID=3229880 RepID=UPI003A812BBF